MTVTLIHLIKLGLSNRDGDIMVGKDDDGICYLIADANTYHNGEFFTGLGSTEHIIISKEAFEALSKL